MHEEQLAAACARILQTATRRNGIVVAYFRRQAEQEARLRSGFGRRYPDGIHLKISTRNRIREIGIRKVNGATTVSILRLFNVDFLKFVVIGIFLGIPFGWYFMNRWLASFAYRTSLDWWIFGLAATASVMVAILTISWQTWRAARSNPVESLRYE